MKHFLSKRYIVHYLIISLYKFQAAGPLFFAVAEFQSLGNWEQFNQALTIAAVLTSIFEPYTKGYCYNAGRSLELSWLGT